MQSDQEIDNIINANNNFNKELLQLLCEDSTDLQENDYENICLITNTELTKKSVSSIEGIELVDTKSSNFREFRIKLPDKASSVLSFLDDHGVIGGLDLGIWWDSLDCYLLIGVDERTSKSDIQKLHDGLSLWLEEVLK